MFDHFDRYCTGPILEANKHPQLPENDDTNNVAITDDTSEQQERGRSYFGGDAVDISGNIPRPQGNDTYATISGPR